MNSSTLADSLILFDLLLLTHSWSVVVVSVHPMLTILSCLREDVDCVLVAALLVLYCNGLLSSVFPTGSGVLRGL